MTVEISVVVPVYRSGKIIPELYQRLSATLEGMGVLWEVVLVDDASGDDTFGVIDSLHERDSRVKIVRFARNMGQHHATLCGIQRASGDFVVTLDDDLQNPPEAIPSFIEKLQEGYDLVIGRIDDGKKHSTSRNLASRIVQVLVGYILGKPKGLALSSYRAMTKRAARGMAAFTGAHVYMPALMLNSVPVERIVNIPVEHHARVDGTSQYNMRKLFRLMSYLLINHSYLPLRFVTAWGFLLCLASFGYALFVVVVAIAYGSSAAGFPTLALLVSFLSGSTLLCMGILGEYVGRLVDENARPRQFPIFEARP